jgi:nucleotide-binding universal stress UspA family protein
MTVLVAIGKQGRPGEVVETAHDLAAAHGEEIDALHVVPSEDFEEHRKAVADLPGTDYSFTHEEDGAAAFAREFVADTVDEPRVDVAGIGRVGDPVEQTLAVVEETDPRYLVIGGRRRSPTGKAVFGDRTQSILLGSPVPVLTVMHDE